MFESRDLPLDEELVSQAQAKDKAAFEQLFHRYYMSIHAFTFRCCLDYTAAEDITQETFIKAARAVSELRQGVAFKAWLYRIARNTTRDWQRSHGRHASCKEAWGEVVRVTAAGRPDTQLAVSDALLELAPDLREAIVLTYYEEMSHAEAARVMGCAESTVSWRVFRAKRFLRKKLRSSSVGHVKDEK